MKFDKDKSLIPACQNKIGAIGEYTQVVYCDEIFDQEEDGLPSTLRLVLETDDGVKASQVYVRDIGDKPVKVGWEALAMMAVVMKDGKQVEISKSAAEGIMSTAPLLGINDLDIHWSAGKFFLSGSSKE